MKKSKRMRFGDTCSAAKQGLVEAAEFRQRVITAASGEFANSRYESDANRLIERFSDDIDQVCGCRAKTARFARSG
jgi:hypothetical protein